MIELSWFDIEQLADKVPRPRSLRHTVYGVPTGGIYAAMAVVRCWNAVGQNAELTEQPEKATVFVDDIVDSGATRAKYATRFPGIPFLALVDKIGVDSENKEEWYSFPWERMQEQSGPEDNIRRILQYIGEDQNREGLKDTPARVVRSYETLFGGYKQSPKDVLTVFEDGACDEMVILRNIEFSSTCEHHMIPFVGTASLGYLPNRRVIGISKLVRILEIYARRLQVQERLTQQITAAMDEYLKPLGSACVIEAKHMCMTCRGVNKQNSVMVTSSLTGEFRKPEVRQEFLSFINR